MRTSSATSAPSATRASSSPSSITQIGGGVVSVAPRTRSAESGGVGDHGHGVAVLQDPLDLLGRGRVVDRHREGPGRPQREVQDGPLVARGRQDGHGLADLDAAGHEPAGHGPDQVVELPGRDVGPAVTGAQGVHRPVRGLGGAPGRDRGERVGDRQRRSPRGRTTRAWVTAFCPPEWWLRRPRYRRSNLSAVRVSRPGGRAALAAQIRSSCWAPSGESARARRVRAAPRQLRDRGLERLHRDAPVQRQQGVPLDQDVVDHLARPRRVRREEGRRAHGPPADQPPLADPGASGGPECPRGPGASRRTGQRSSRPWSSRQRRTQSS